MPIGLGTGIALAGGANLLGGFANIFNNNKANKANARAIERANAQNYEAQKEFYKNSIQWRKEDALKAGINPIYALGAQGAQFSPSFSAAQQTPNNYNFIGGAAQAALEYYNAQKQLEIQQQQAEANIKRDNAQAELFLAQRDQIQGANATKIQGAPTKKTSMIDKKDLPKAQTQYNFDGLKSITPNEGTFEYEKNQDSLFGNEAYKTEASQKWQNWAQKIIDKTPNATGVLAYGSYYDGIDWKRFWDNDIVPPRIRYKTLMKGEWIPSPKEVYKEYSNPTILLKNGIVLEITKNPYKSDKIWGSDGNYYWIERRTK